MKRCKKKIIFGRGGVRKDAFPFNIPYINNSCPAASIIFFSSNPGNMVVVFFEILTYGIIGFWHTLDDTISS